MRRLDVHSPAAFDNAFDFVKEHLSAAPLFAEHFVPLVRGADKLVVLSPDAGGIGRARLFAAQLAERTHRPVDAIRRWYSDSPSSSTVHAD